MVQVMSSVMQNMKGPITSVHVVARHLTELCKFWGSKYFPFVFFIHCKNEGKTSQTNPIKSFRGETKM